jgi:alpha-tubulin suppressor-like RCC1 family protein
MLPAGVRHWVPFLLQREWRNAMEVRTVAAGQNRSFFVGADGALLACGKEGDEEVGLLGLQNPTSRRPFTAVAPTPVPSMAGVRIRAVVTHDQLNVALSEAGQVFAWGHPPVAYGHGFSKEQPPVPTVMEELRDHRVRQIAIGENHCAAITEDGALFTWQICEDEPAPWDPVPELGYGRAVDGYGVPHRVFALEGVRIASVAVGAGFTVGVTEAGAVYSFGTNRGCLGHGKDNSRGGVLLPKRIEALDGVPVATVAAGASHVLALTTRGHVYSWGDENAPRPVCGRGSGGDEGGERGAEDHYRPQLITALLGERVRSIVACSNASCAVTDAGGLYTWGVDCKGHLGQGRVAQQDSPKLVLALDGIHVVGVSIYTKHMLALAADGSVYPFGAGPGLGIRTGVEGEEAEEGATSGARSIPDLVVMVPG